jgi:hypothetical protein
MKTAVQQVFSDLEELHPNLFNVYTTEGKEFINHFHKYIAMEKQQIIEACNEWFTEGCRYATGFEQTLWQDEEDYYNQTFNNETNSSRVVF